MNISEGEFKMRLPYHFQVFPSTFAGGRTTKISSRSQTPKIFQLLKGKKMRLILSVTNNMLGRANLAFNTREVTSWFPYAILLRGGEAVGYRLSILLTNCEKETHENLRPV